MSRVGLKHVIGRSAEARALLDGLALAVGRIAVEDPAGRLLHGDPVNGNARRVPVVHDGADLGWVSGAAGSEAVAQLLGHLVARETERKALGSEVLHLYREINLIYAFSEKLAALLDVERVADLTLNHARQFIVATDGVVMLLDDLTAELHTVAGFGDELPRLQGFRSGRGIVGTVVASGVGEIVNDVEQDPRRVTEQPTVRALIAAPLRVGERVTGIIAIGSTVPMSYTAAELKLLNTLALQSATAIENARLFESTVQAAHERERLLARNREVEIARARLESELTVAARIQSDLFPAVMPAVDGYDLAARNRPARQCGGDYYDAIRVGDGPDGRVLLCVADVAGKGLPAALVMSNMQATLRALLGRVDSLPDLADRASGLLFASTAAEKYVTATLVDLQPSTGTIRFVGAGHVDTLILRASGEHVTLASTGMPLGLLPPLLPYAQVDVALEPGDLLVLYSDGVTEAQNLCGDEFGEARLLECLRAERAAPSADVIDCVLDAIDAFAGDAAQFDDITLLIARRQ